MEENKDAGEGLLPQAEVTAAAAAAADAAGPTPPPTPPPTSSASQEFLQRAREFIAADKARASAADHAEMSVSL